MRYLRDIVGPYKGQLRKYLDHAADTAIGSGFAEPVSDADVEAYLRGEDLPEAGAEETEPEGSEMEESDAEPVSDADVEAYLRGEDLPEAGAEETEPEGSEMEESDAEPVSDADQSGRTRRRRKAR